MFCGVSVLPSSLKEVLSCAVALSRPLLEYVHCLVVTLGAKGVLVCGEYDAGSVNLKPRKQKRVRMTSTHDDNSDDDITVTMMFTAPAFAEGSAMCSLLPGSDCDNRGDHECLRSRR